MLGSLEDVANSHDNTAATLNGEISNTIRGNIQSKSEERGQVTRQMRKLEGDLGKAGQAYDKVKLMFDKSDKEASAAKDIFVKVS